MPNDTFDSVLVSQFTEQLHVEQQQMTSMFRPYADNVPLNGEDFFYDSIGVIEDAEIVGRNVPSTATDPNFSRRRGLTRRFSATVFVDNHDIERMLADPSAELTRACLAAMQRRYDRVFYEALFADVRIGKNAAEGVVTTFASDGGRTVNATAGLTYAKLLEGLQNYIDDDVEASDLVFVGTGDEHTAMMNLSQLTSGDYSRQFAVDNGSIQKALGMDLLWFAASVNNPIVLLNSGGFRECALFRKNAVRVGINKDISVTIKDRPDLINNTQIQVTMTVAAVRKEGKLVQKVTTTP